MELPAPRRTPAWLAMQACEAAGRHVDDNVGFSACKRLRPEAMMFRDLGTAIYWRRRATVIMKHHDC